MDSPKTGLRFCPLFPELREVLSEAFGLAPDGAVFVVSRYRQGQNLRTQFGRIIQSAGLVPWPKPFNNLRASRRTELQEQFPSHVIDSWLGHSTKVAERHYLQVTEDHWAAAVESCTPIRPPISNQTEPIRKNQGTKKPRKNRGCDGWGGELIPAPMTPTGLEHVTKLGRNLQRAIDVPPHVPPSGTIEAELVEVWARLSHDDRLAVIEFARRLVR